MIVGSVILTLIIIFIALSFKEDSKDCKKVYLIPFWKISIWILKKIYKRKSIREKIFKEDTITNLKSLNPGIGQECYITNHYANKLMLTIFIIFFSAVMSIISGVSNVGKDEISEGGYITKSDYGASSEEKELIVSVDGEESDIVVEIPAIKYDEYIIDKIFDDIQNELPNFIKGSNENLESVASRLNLPSSYADYPITIKWHSQDSDIIKNNGIVNNVDLVMPQVVELSVALTYEEYEREFSYYVTVQPIQLSERERLIKEIKEKINSINENNTTDEKYILPSTVSGKDLFWRFKVDDNAVTFVALGILLGVFAYYGKDKELDKELKKRDKELILDYPEIVSKLTLLLGAGMTMRGAWGKIVKDYLIKRKDNEKHYKYSYEEMAVTYNEIENGISEVKAYEEFGKRCKNSRYLKMSAIIVQNLKKGSKGLSHMLMLESNSAYEDRKALAKIAGEEASTKLMIPMVLMLVVVMILIIVPALGTFN